MAARVTPPATARRFRPTAYGIVVGILVLVLTFLMVYPVLGMIARAWFSPPSAALDIIAATFSDPRFWIAVRNTFAIIVIANAVAVPIACIFAWLNERTDARMGALSTLLPVIPLLLPPVALSIGWLFLADQHAGFLTHVVLVVARFFGFTLERLPVNIASWPGLIFLYVLYIVPHAYVLAAAAFRALDPALEEAARVSGRGTLRVFWTVSLPAIRPAIASAVLGGTISSFGLYSIPAVIGVPAQITVLSVYIARLVRGQYPPLLGQAVTIGIAMIILIAALWILQRQWSARIPHAQIGGMGVRPNRLALGRWRWPARGIMLLFVLATSIAPLTALILVSLESYWTPNLLAGGLSWANFSYFVGQPKIRAAILNSMGLAIGSGTLLVLIAGLLATFARGAGGATERSLGILTKLPSAVPHIVFAVGAFATLAFAPFYLHGTLWILLVSYVVVFLPQASIAAEAAVQQVGKELIEASRIYGSDHGRTTIRVILPLIMSGLAAGWAMVFALIMGELNVAALLSGPSNPVIGYVILDVFEHGTYSQLGAMGAIIGVVATVSVGSVLLFARPRFNRSAAGG